MQPIPNHPYAFYETEWIPRLRQLKMHFACNACGDRTEHYCSRPQLQGYRVQEYGAWHAHGVPFARPIPPPEWPAHIPWNGGRGPMGMVQQLPSGTRPGDPPWPGPWRGGR